MMKIILLMALLHVALWAQVEGSIVFIRGVGSYKQHDTSLWKDAHIKQALYGGDRLKTASKSQMGIVFNDKSQIRMAPKSQLQIELSSQKGGVSLWMKIGRIFSQANKPSKALEVHTSSVTATIRGTKWYMQADANETFLHVNEGVVVLKNSQGMLHVKAGESALTQKGKAPQKYTIATHKSRINWVNIYTIKPLVYIREYVEDINALEIEAHNDIKQFEQRLKSAITCNNKATCKWLKHYAKNSWQIYADRITKAQKSLASRIDNATKPHSADLKLYGDILIYMGAFAKAHKIYAQGKTLYPNDSDFSTLEAHLYMIEGAFDKATKCLESVEPNEYTYKNYGKLQELLGNAKGAKEGYIKAIKYNDTFSDGWLALGEYYLMRSDYSKAQDALQKVLKLNPYTQEALGALAQVKSEVNNFTSAQKYFKKALALDEQNYLVLTALGYMQLKEGKNKEALQTLLKAELIEPKYEPVYEHLAVAYYRLDEISLALRALRHASEVDPHNPIPYQIKSMILTDRNRFGEAVVAAKEAKKRLKYLKSMNKILSDAKGGANMGQSFVKFGMYETTMHYASESYVPQWAGSHFFMANHLRGYYQQNSELIQGFLLDPLSFGASNQLQSIYDSPGNYGYVTGFITSSDPSKIYGYSASVNGLNTTFIPMSYFARFLEYNAKQRADDIVTPDYSLRDITSKNLYDAITMAVGAQPMEYLNTFVYYQYQHKNGLLSNKPSSYSYNHIEPDMTYHRVTLGGSYALGALDKLSFKSSLFSAKNATRYSVNDLVSSIGFSLEDTRDNHTNTLNDISMLYTTALDDDSMLHSGLIAGSHSETNRRTDSFVQGAYSFSMTDHYKAKEDDVHLFVDYSMRLLLNVHVEMGLWYSQINRNAKLTTDTPPLLDPVTPKKESFAHNDVLPRLGVKYRINDTLLFRGAMQYWRKPLAYSSLEPILTSGVPLNVTYVQSGGALERYLLQAEYENAHAFFTLYGDYQKVHNDSYSFLAGQYIGDEEYLDDLQNSDITTRNFASNDMIESDVTSIEPFMQGEIFTAGIGYNQLLFRDFSLFMRLGYFQTRNTSTAYRNNYLPGFPTYALSSGLSWLLEWGLSSYIKTTYRGERYFDNANSEKKVASFDVDAALKYELPNKMFSLNIGLYDMLDVNKDGWGAVNVGIKF